MKSFTKSMLAATLVAGVATPAFAANDLWRRSSEADELAAMTAAIPLVDAVNLAESETGAKAIEVDFEDEDGTFVYVVELLTPDGTELEVTIDSSELRVLSIENDD
jgi:uncharacterized membrane protein YkoI